ncbi:MAG: hypothetical protein P8R42_14955 [Candidatus Binatia bacterium]|nr:hypothetical protein [Candidatus Binatia bacterium]
MAGFGLALPPDRVGAQAAATGEAFTPIIGSVLGGETASVRGSDGRYYVVYELQLTNAKWILAEVQPIISKAVKDGSVKVVSAVYDLKTGRVDLID